MAKLTKEQSKKHTQVMELVNSDRALTYDEKVFVLENYHESQGQLNSLAGAFFTPPGLARDFSIEVPDNCSVIDLCAGIGALSFPLIHHYNTKRDITCVERCVEYVQVGRRILPEATWINDDVFDHDYFNFDFLSRNSPFDVAISNPPFGRIKEDTYKGAYTGGEFEYKVIELASRIANYGIFILPQQSAPFAYSGVRQYERRVSGKCAKFIEQTGIFLNPGCGVDTAFYLEDWKGVKPLCEIVLSDFVDREDCT